jgi:2-polyprenyl-3-methyl-5-hydroxy-6-metoxy-1,4-benzoquinol methylase
MDFSRRSYQPELLDGDDIPFDAISKNMSELDFINRWLGGHAITLAGVKALAGGKKEISVCEIGCGGGDNLQAIQRWCHTQNIRLTITGIDINPDCIKIAKQKFPDDDSLFISSDYQFVEFKPQKPDIIFASLFCHHFTAEQLKNVFSWMGSHAGVGFFINDLHRHPLAYYSIKYLTAIFSHSYLVKNDAPLSVLRGFSRKDLEAILYEAGIENYRLAWKWAFRWLLIIKNIH